MVANHEPSSCSTLLTPPYYNRVSLLQSSLLSTLPLEIIRTIIYARELNSVNWLFSVRKSYLAAKLACL